MILDKQHDLEAFRTAVREWVEGITPPDWRQKMARPSHAEYAAFQHWWMRERAKVGLATPHWPKQYGGADLSLTHQAIIAEEVARAGAPSMKMFTVSLNHIPGTLLAWGTEAQKARYLPGVARGDVWCQGFSEPNAGSDLAALKTRAVRDGDHFVINGQKIWSSYSMYASYCILLARSNPNAGRHGGITFFIMDMKAPGVEVRPIHQADDNAEFGELFLQDVRIPLENVVGEVDKGWEVAMTTLAAERGVLAFERSERHYHAFEGMYRSAVEADAAWLRDDAMRREFMTLFGELQASRRMIRRLLRENEHDHAGSWLTSAVVKCSSTELWKRICDFISRTQGLDSQVVRYGPMETGESPMQEWLSSFGGTIAAGSSEIMRNIISERGLGLPR